MQEKIMYTIGISAIIIFIGLMIFIILDRSLGSTEICTGKIKQCFSYTEEYDCSTTTQINDIPITISRTCTRVLHSVEIINPNITISVNSCQKFLPGQKVNYKYDIGRFSGNSYGPYID